MRSLRWLIPACTALLLFCAAAGGATRAVAPHAHVKAAPKRPAKRPAIKRSAAAKSAFERTNPCPSTGRSSGACKGYIVDHVKPLACGGADAPNNMQWQTVAAAKAKDKVERVGCKP